MILKINYKVGDNVIITLLDFETTYKSRNKISPFKDFQRKFNKTAFDLQLKTAKILTKKLIKRRSLRFY